MSRRTPSSVAPTPPTLWARARGLRGDLNASIVVFLLGLPLALGISLTAGAPLSAGLIAATVGGLIPGLIGRIPLQISGPAVGVTLVAAPVGFTYGFEALCWVTCSAGLLQLALSRLHFARVARMFPTVVLHGMLAGVGISIVVSQALVLLEARPGRTPLQSLRILPAALGNSSLDPLLVAGTTWLLSFLWQRLPFRRLLPAALVAIAGTAGLTAWMGWQVRMVTLPMALWSQGPQGWPELPWLALAANAAGLALMASLYTVLCAMALAPANAPTAVRDLDRELVAQGAANMVSGALGGLPVTGVLARSVANITAGATGRTANFLHGIWLLLSMALGAAWMQVIPLASLAALFMVVGASLVKPAELRAAPTAWPGAGVPSGRRGRGGGEPARRLGGGRGRIPGQSPPERSDGDQPRARTGLNPGAVYLAIACSRPKSNGRRLWQL